MKHTSPALQGGVLTTRPAGKSLAVVLICVFLMLSTFHLPAGHQIAVFGNVSLQILDPFLNWVVWGFATEMVLAYFE